MIIRSVIFSAPGFKFTGTIDCEDLSTLYAWCVRTCDAKNHVVSPYIVPCDLWSATCVHTVCLPSKPSDELVLCCFVAYSCFPGCHLWNNLASRVSMSSLRFVGYRLTCPTAITLQAKWQIPYTSHRIFTCFTHAFISSLIQQ